MPPTSDNGAEAFRAASAALNDLGDKQLRNDVYAGFRKAARPLGDSVVRKGSAEMPKRGGFSAEIAKAKASQSNATTGRNPGVALTFRTRPSHNLKALDEGVLRHKTFGHKPWKAQAVKPGAFSRPFEAGQPAVRDELFRVLEEAAARIARMTNGHKL